MAALPDLRHRLRSGRADGPAGGRRRHRGAAAGAAGACGARWASGGAARAATRTEQASGRQAAVGEVPRLCRPARHQLLGPSGVAGGKEGQRVERRARALRVGGRAGRDSGLRVARRLAALRAHGRVDAARGLCGRAEQPPESRAGLVARGGRSSRRPAARRR